MRDIIRTITKQEWRVVLWTTTALIVVTTAPYIFNYLTTPRDLYYPGMNYTGSGDLYAYYSQIDQARNGQWLFENKFTSEPQHPAMFQPLWLVLGIAGSLFHLSNFTVYQIARIILTALLMPLAYLFFSHFFLDRQTRILALWLLAFSSGFLVTYASEATIFTIVFHSPLLVLSIMLLIAIFYVVMQTLEKKIRYGFWLAGIFTLALLIVHPYDLVTVWVALVAAFFVFAILRRYSLSRLIYGLLIILLLSSFGLIYYYYIFSREPALGGWALQNIMLSPNLFYFLLGYGLLIPLTIGGIYRYFIKERKHRSVFIFALVWLVVSFCLFYGPFQFNLKLVLGMQVPMIVFSAYFLVYIKEAWYHLVPQRKAQNIVAISVIVLLTLSNIIWVFGTIWLSARPGYFLPRKLIEGLQFLKTLWSF